MYGKMHNWDMWRYRWEQQSWVEYGFWRKCSFCGNCFDGFFEQINSCRFGNTLFVEIQKLGDYDGFYKDWSMKKYMQTMYEICEDMDGVWVSNYEYVDDDPAFRAFLLLFCLI